MVTVTVRVKASVIALRLRHALRNACIDRRPAVARAEYYLPNASYAWATDRDRTAAVVRVALRLKPGNDRRPQRSRFQFSQCLALICSLIFPTELNISSKFKNKS